MSTFTDRDGDEFRVAPSDDNKPGLLDIIVNGADAVTFYAEDAPEIIRLIQEATK